MSTKAFNSALKILFALAVLHFNPANSQATDSLKVYSVSSDFPQIVNGDSALEGSFYPNIQVGVINLSSSPFSGNIYFQLQIDTGGAFTFDSLLVDSNPVSINPFDTLYAAINPYTFSSVKYKAGSNIVVVWPKLVNGNPLYQDSLVTEVFFVPLNNITAHSDNNYFGLYPNPVKDFIYVFSESEKDIEGVRFYDEHGKAIKEFRKPSRRRFSVAEFDTGCYFIEIILGNQRKITRKFLKISP